MTGQDRSMVGTTLFDLLGCERPVLLACMGGIACCELAAAVAEAGGWATLGMLRKAPDLIESAVCAPRAAMHRPFAVNLIPAATEIRAQTRLPVVVVAGAITQRIGRMTSKAGSPLVRLRPQDRRDGERP